MLGLVLVDEMLWQGFMKDKEIIEAQQKMLEGKDKFYLSSSHNEESTAYTLLNAAINYEPTNLKISIWGKNLFNEEVVIRGFGGFGNDPRKYYEVEPYYQLGSPRTYGLTLKYEF